MIFWSGVKNDFFKKCLLGEKTSNFSFFQKKLAESGEKSFLYFSRINHQILRGLRQKKCFHDFYFSQNHFPKKKVPYGWERTLFLLPTSDSVDLWIGGKTCWMQNIWRLIHNLLYLAYLNLCANFFLCLHFCCCYCFLAKRFIAQKFIEKRKDEYKKLYIHVSFFKLLFYLAWIVINLASSCFSSYIHNFWKVICLYLIHRVQLNDILKEISISFLW